MGYQQRAQADARSYCLCLASKAMVECALHLFFDFPQNRVDEFYGFYF